MEKVYSIDIDAPIVKVFAEITKVNAQSRPMFDTHMRTDLKPGSRYYCESKSGARTFTTGEIVEVTPPGKESPAAARFVQTFKFTNLPDDETLVTWELSETSPGRTRVKIVHSQFPGETKTFKAVDGGWPSILGRLKLVCETGKIGMKDRLMFAMMKSMMFMMPKSTLSANVRAADRN